MNVPIAKMKICSVLFLALLLQIYSSVAQAEIYTERGKRYYKVFVTDFNLEDNRINDDQALHILRILKQYYEKDYLGGGYLHDIWENIDDIYAGGNYHGQMILTIFRIYLNVAFTQYHNKFIGGGQNWVIPSYVYRRYSKTRLNDSKIVGRLPRQYLYNIYYRCEFRIIPYFRNYNVVHSVIKKGYKAYFENDDLAGEAASKCPSKEDLIAHSVRESCMTIEKLLIHIDRTIRSDDAIFSSGEFDLVLLKLADQ